MEEKSKFGIIIQARILSTRLPKKIILDIGDNNTFLDVLLRKIVKNFDSIPIILATSDNESNDVLESFSNKYNIHIYRGSEYNVLQRFVDSAKKHNINTIIRICSDNPFLDEALLKSLIDSYQNEDYLSYSINNIPSVLTHYGFFAEIVKTKALEKVVNDSLCLEHVTNCIYNNKENFDVRFIEFDIEEKNIRCTLDTDEDFENLKKIYNNFYKKNKENSYEKIVNFIKRDKQLLNKMSSEILKNKK